MTTTFTPGPWVSVKDKGSYWIRKPEAGGEYIADVENLSDAALIVAAPDMYNMLEKIANRYPNSPWIYKEINALLAKTRGEEA